MKERAPTPPTQADASLLIFDWSRGGRIRWGSWLAVLVVLGCFVMLIFAVRVRMAPPVAWAAPQAGLIHLGMDDEAGRLLGLRAQAEGPFPSRFAIASWDGFAVFEKKVFEATRMEFQPHDPQLRGFPQADVGQSGLAPRGEPVLPARPLGPLIAPQVGKLARIPEISPVSGLGVGDWREPLPAFGAEIGDTLAAQSWRFMLRLDSAGQVRECISLAGSAELGVAAIGKWLKSLEFTESDTAGDRWVALSVEFKNQVVTDGTDAE